MKRKKRRFVSQQQNLHAVWFPVSNWDKALVSTLKTSFPPSNVALCVLGSRNSPRKKAKSVSLQSCFPTTVAFIHIESSLISRVTLHRTLGTAKIAPKRLLEEVGRWLITRPFFFRHFWLRTCNSLTAVHHFCHPKLDWTQLQVPGSVKPTGERVSDTFCFIRYIPVVYFKIIIFVALTLIFLTKIYLHIFHDDISPTLPLCAEKCAVKYFSQKVLHLSWDAYLRSEFVTMLFY